MKNHCVHLQLEHGLWPSRLLCPWDSLGKNTGVDCHFLLQGIFPTTQGSNLGLWHCRQILYDLSHKGSPNYGQQDTKEPKTQLPPLRRREQRKGKRKWSRSVVSDSLWPHGLYSPWNSPGQNTRVGRLSLLRGSSQPRAQIQVSCIAGGFLTSWATREAQEY